MKCVVNNVRTTIIHKDKAYRDGDEIDLPDDMAARLSDIVTPIAKPKKAKEDQDHAEG